MRLEEIGSDKREEALALVWKVFMQYEAPDYSEEGIATFKAYIADDEKMRSLAIYAAFEDEKIVGVIATRNEGNHVSLLFVDGKMHRRGIGRHLFSMVLRNSTADRITVNSSPYAVAFYHKLGFVDLDSEQIKDGLRYTPMLYTK